RDGAARRGPGRSRGRARIKDACSGTGAGVDRGVRWVGRVYGRSAAAGGLLAQAGRMRRETRDGRRNAFTLIEVIVVVAIIGVVMGVSGLALASLKTPRESDQVRALRDAR